MKPFILFLGFLVLANRVGMALQKSLDDMKNTDLWGMPKGGHHYLGLIDGFCRPEPAMYPVFYIEGFLLVYFLVVFLIAFFIGGKQSIKNLL